MENLILPKQYKSELNLHDTQPVSYTHLTLPTKLEV